jgi:exodeoxyribonuclease V alpha subunit
MIIFSAEIRVTSIRSVGKFGGVIFAGVDKSNKFFVVVGDNKIMPVPAHVGIGQRWAIKGTLSRWRNQNQISATAASLIRPSGDNIIDWISKSKECPGVGAVKARKLYDRFGLMLIDHIQAKRFDLLTEVLSRQSAEALCRALEQCNYSCTLLWLDQLGIDRTIGVRITEFYQEKAQEKIEGNPYRLISFGESWAKVDQFARYHFAIRLNDARRLDAAVEEVLYGALRDGHTALPFGLVKTRLGSLLRSHDLACEALATAILSSQYRRVFDMFQPAGAYLIEKYIAEKLKALAKSDEARSYQPKVERATDLILTKWEGAYSIILTAEQREAVNVSAASNLSLILGGAGTGKTTVLKALYATLQQQYEGIRIHQIALAGRAAQRMSEATGLLSMTIASFLLKIDNSELGEKSVVVIDEMSMVDVITMYRLLLKLPVGTKLVLVGDPAQLAPIGPGLVLHVLADHPSIRQTKLNVVKRQDAESGIPAVAAMIRLQNVPKLKSYVGPGAGVFFYPCKNSEVESDSVRIYYELGGQSDDTNIRILSLTNRGHSGVRNLNKIIQGRRVDAATPVRVYDPISGRRHAYTSDGIALSVGDLVMYTENDYIVGLRNGALGRIVEGVDPLDPNMTCCVCEFDGVIYRLNSQQCCCLRHAYAITVHKSQGSQFKRVVIPLRKSRLVDQSVIYTAITRGIEQIVLVGEWDTFCSAVRLPSSSARRQINFGSFLNANFPRDGI